MHVVSHDVSRISFWEKSILVSTATLCQLFRYPESMNQRVKASDQLQQWKKNVFSFLDKNEKKVFIFSKKWKKVSFLVKNEKKKNSVTCTTSHNLIFSIYATHLLVPTCFSIGKVIFCSHLIITSHYPHDLPLWV